MARRSQPAVWHGLVAIDKPAGITSHDVVARCRRVFGQRQVGHGGTLDPGATGVLLVGLGGATRLLRFLGELPKSYEGELVLGIETSTLDADGEVVATHDMTGVTLDDVRAAARRFVGPIEQVPPMVSAVKVGGRRLHELARSGLHVERAGRPVVVHRLDVAPGEGPGVFRLSLDCSSGTYVRSLAADLGGALGGGAHLRRLRRTAVGPFAVADARPLDEVGPDDVLPPVRAVAHLARVAVPEPTARVVRHGAVLRPEDTGMEGEGPWAVVDGDGALLAVYERRPDGTAKPSVVLPPQ
ncbi:MAG TPA: tRNA pseudouridine(55) synthase TruB [Acidimicrobiales bacterium]|nr:tRNA pseudouridine(55) synthase TruB [Acidimicrobiales bacterium]